MSFILDALKKLEQTRNKGSVPDLTTMHASHGEKPKKRLIWLYLIVIALLINAGILLAWLKPWESEKQITSEQSTSEKRELASTEQIKSLPEKAVQTPDSSVAEKIKNTVTTDTEKVKSSPEPGGVKDESTEVLSTSTEKPGIDQPVGTAEKSEIIKSLTDTETEALRSFLPDEKELGELHRKIKEEREFNVEPLPVETDIPDSSVKPEPVSQQQVIELSQLPAEIKNELPKISINTHIYSNSPSSRIVNINGIVLREGEDISKGLTLEEITTTGIILTYKDHRFRIRAF